MSDRPSSFADAMYGPSGPISGGPDDPRTRAVIEAGIAKPSGASILGNRPNPAPGEGRQPAAPAKPAASESTAPAKPSAAEALYGPVTFDPSKFTPPEGARLDNELMAEFAGAAKELKLGQEGGSKLLELHTKAVAKQHEQLQHTWSSWMETTKRDFGERLPQVVNDIKGAVGDDPDAKRFYELMEWSGLGSEPAVIRVLHRLATGGR